MDQWYLKKLIIIHLLFYMNLNEFIMINSDYK